MTTTLPRSSISAHSCAFRGRFYTVVEVSPIEAYDCPTPPVCFLQCSTVS